MTNPTRTAEQQHVIECADSWLRAKRLPTFTELLAALEKAASHVHPDLPEFAECERLIYAAAGSAA